MFQISSLIQSAVSRKEISVFFNTFTGTSLAAALSEGKFFTTFLTVASETHWQKNEIFA